MLGKGLVPSVKFVSDCLPGDGLGRKLPHHLPHSDGGAEGAQRQRHGCAGGLRLRPVAQLEAHGQ